MSEHKVLIAFTKDAIEVDKERQLCLYEDLGWDIYEINDYKRIDYVKAFAEEAKRAGADRFCVLNEAEDVNFTNLIFDTCSNIIETEVRDVSYSRLTENNPQATHQATVSGVAINNGSNQNPNTVVQNTMNGQYKQSNPLIDVCLLVNPQIATDLANVKRGLMDPAFRFVSGFDQIKANFLQVLKTDSQVPNSVLAPFANTIINNSKVDIKPKIIFVDGDQKEDNLCQAYTADQFLDLVWNGFDEPTVRTLKQNNCKYSIDMQNPNNFFVRLKTENKNPSFMIVYNMNKNVSEYKPFDAQSPVFVVNDVRLNTNRQVNLPNVLGVFNSILNSFNFNPNAFPTSFIKEHNIKMKEMAGKIAEDIVSKNYKPKHKVCSNSEVEVKTRIDPASKFIYGFAKFNRNLAVAAKAPETKKYPYSHEEKTSHGFNLLHAFTKAVAEEYKDKLFSAATDELDRQKQAMHYQNWSQDTALQKYGIDPEKNKAITLHEDFPKLVNVLFPDVKVVYDKHKN